jgi:phosphatidylinositol alpha-1,6-mannosyltransferase
LTSSSAAPPLRVTMLLSDGFGGKGGIAKFNRDLLEALSQSPDIERTLGLPRLIPAPISGRLPEFVRYDRRAAKGKLAFTRRVVTLILSREAPDLVICAHINLLPLGFILARLRRARLALVIHGIDAWTPTRSSLANRLARHADTLLSVSRYSAERFAAWSGFPAGRTTILPNCVDLERFVPGPRDEKLARRYGLDGAQVILTVGRLAPEERYKGFDQILELLPDLLASRPKLKYMIVGEGGDRARLKAKARGLGVSAAVIFAGFVAEEEKIAHYHLADAYVMPSTGEGFGIVLVEAAACGLPVIGANAGGSREALLEGKLGRLVDPQDKGALLAAIEAALDGKPPLPRPPDVATFGVDAFRSRVAAWARARREERRA